MKPAPRTSADTTEAVDVFMKSLQHPNKSVVQSLRGAIMEIDASVCEGVKWNAPSFRTREYFATTNLRAKTGVGVILHFGAKVRKRAAGPQSIVDPRSLLTWLAKDRATIVFADKKDFTAKKAAFQAVVRQWITYL